MGIVYTANIDTIYISLPVTERESWISLMTFPSVLSIPDCIAMGTIKARGFHFLAGPRLPDGVARDEAQDPVQEAISVK